MKKPGWNLEWNEEIYAGIPDIGANHQRFISLINELNRSITEYVKTTDIHKRLQLVIDHTERYFEQQERYFQEWQYPKADVHASSHKLVLKILKRIRDSLMPHAPEAQWPNAALRVKNILVSHVLAEDVQCELFQTSNYGRSSSKEKQEWRHPH